MSKFKIAYVAHLIFLLENVGLDCQKKITAQIIFPKKGDTCTGFATTIKYYEKTNIKNRNQSLLVITLYYEIQGVSYIPL